MWTTQMPLDVQNLPNYHFNSFPDPFCRLSKLIFNQLIFEGFPASNSCLNYPKLGLNYLQETWSDVKPWPHKFSEILEFAYVDDTIFSQKTQEMTDEVVAYGQKLLSKFSYEFKGIDKSGNPHDVES